MKQYSTRNWKHPEGYKYLAPWSNAVLLRFLMRKFTETLPRLEFRMRTQVNDACRSVVANIEEGFKRPDRKAYLEYLGFSQGSLEEVKGDVRRLHQDKFLLSKPGSSLTDLHIDLKEFKGLLEEDKGNSPLEVLYAPLASLIGKDVTFEMFMELINKTDWLLQGLVRSLEETTAKEDVVSPFNRWLGKEMEVKQQKDKELEEQLKEIMEGKRKDLNP